MPYALAARFLTPEQEAGVWRYMQLHGSRLLGLVRAGAYALYGREAPFPVSGTDQVYGTNASRFLADRGEADQLVLSLYGQLAAAMTPGTFLAGEAASVAPVPGRERTMYLPPNGAANGAFLETLRLMLVHETPDGLELAYSTPRAWLAPGKRVAVTNAPTAFGPVAFSIAVHDTSADVTVNAPARAKPRTLKLRLRLPDGRRIASVTLGGKPYRNVDVTTGTIDLSGAPGRCGSGLAFGKTSPKLRRACAASCCFCSRYSSRSSRLRRRPAMRCGSSPTSPTTRSPARSRSRSGRSPTARTTGSGARPSSCCPPGTARSSTSASRS